MCYFVFGKRFHIDDSEFCDIIQFVKCGNAGLTMVDPVAFIPWLRYFPLKHLTMIHEHIRLRDPIFRKNVLAHRNTFNRMNIRDFTDSLLKSSEEEETWKTLGTKEDINDHMEMLIADMFSAGTETVVSTLEWIIVYLLHWPKFQDKIYDEIIRVIGTNRYPNPQDRPSLPFAMATIQETLRLSSVTPFGDST